MTEKTRELNLKILSVEQAYETTRRQCHTLQRNLQSATEDRDDLKNRLNVCEEIRSIFYAINQFFYGILDVYGEKSTFEGRRRQES